MTTDKKTAPRQFWLLKNKGDYPFHSVTFHPMLKDFESCMECVHTIEYSAYALKVAELEDAKEHTSDAKALREQRGIDMKKITALESQLKEANEKNTQMNYKFASVKDGVDVMANDNEELKTKLALAEKRLEKCKEQRDYETTGQQGWMDQVNFYDKELEEIKA